MGRMALAGGPPAPRVLRDYAFLGDGERGALLGPHGDLVWLCVPRWDSDAVISPLIGGAGEYHLSPADPWHIWGGHYEDGTLIRVTRWITMDSVTECRDALAMPADPDRAVLLRRVRAVSGTAHLRLLLDVRPRFGHDAMVDLRWQGTCWSARGGGLHLRFTAAGARPAPGGGLRGTLTVPEGEERDIVLEIGTREGTDALDADRLWRSTEAEWRRSVPDCSSLAAPRDTRHAYAVLRGLTSTAGGMAAAATTSLPERANVNRNYDYRFAWIRDQCYAGLAVAAHGPHPLLDQAVRFITERVLEDGPKLRPAYTVTGDRVAPERPLSFLAGFPGGSNRVGNRAAQQFQLDTFGEVLQLYAAAARHDRLDTDARRAADVTVEAVAGNWTRRDAGLWELDERWWAHSRLSVVTGLRQLADALPGSAARRWTELADRILSETARRCLHPNGHWCRAEDDEGLDAGLLLPLARGCVPANDPSALRTRAIVADQLSREGYLYRFRHGEQPFHEAESAFVLCGFMMTLAAQRQGDEIGAFRWFERTRSACGPPGLFAEEFDISQRQLRGNLPQAFVHALLLECSVRLSDSGASQF
ncbi:glycoside hydrolase family 15 protein [Streptomyces gobiensis]|uniref:glycoside hydrolase family 15 protein n=1 Tax=Streptomyces gobiensis TaxID=2875706 RepID=UPI001E3F8007|nr:glycoside hydrolase family 15 protein [Streptomyces gobiensis]UGY91821.1 glycoside hydrolase family 15 protein [Streptomyces gobiensis]